MIRFDKSIVIDAPVEKVFAYLMDPAHLREYMTGLDEVKDVVRLPNGGYRYTVVMKMIGFHNEMTSEDVEVVPNERAVSRMDGALFDGVSDVRFESLDGGKTRVRFIGEGTLHGGPLGRLGEPFFEKYFDHSAEMEMAAVKAHIEMAPLAATPI